MNAAKWRNSELGRGVSGNDRCDSDNGVSESSDNLTQGGPWGKDRRKSGGSTTDMAAATRAGNMYPDSGSFLASFDDGASDRERRGRQNGSLAATVSDVELLIYAARAVVRRWREGKSCPDEIAGLDVALSRYDSGSSAAFNPDANTSTFGPNQHLTWTSVPEITVHDASEETYFAINLIVRADSQEEADSLLDRMQEAIGCTDDPDHECPHFRFAAVKPLSNEEPQSWWRRLISWL